MLPPEGLLFCWSVSIRRRVCGTHHRVVRLVYVWQVRRGSVGKDRMCKQVCGPVFSVALL